MDLKLIRKEFYEHSTIGELYINGVHECYVLEDRIRDEKIHGETAIPYGRYEVVVTYSPRFGRYLPLLLNVPGFSGIRIHKGNTHRDTGGCLIVGQVKSGGQVLNSGKAFDRFYPKLVFALQNNGKVFIEITK